MLGYKFCTLPPAKPSSGAKKIKNAFVSFLKYSRTQLSSLCHMKKQMCSASQALKCFFKIIQGCDEVLWLIYISQSLQTFHCLFI